MKLTKEEIEKLPEQPIGRAKDLTGQKFGRLTALKRSLHKSNAAYWWCQCECGEIVEVCASHLTCGQTLSCGCLLKDKLSSIPRSKNLIGQRFGKLTVIKDSGQRGHNRAVLWECLCDCGNTILVRSDQLTIGHTGSCGCRINSKGEEKIKEILNENNISYKTQYSFKDLRTRKNGVLRFDFAIFSNGSLIKLIEFDGQQHFKEVFGIWSTKSSLEEIKIRDKMKNEYCFLHHIPLLRIPYNKIQEITIEKLLNEETPYMKD